MAYNLPPPWDPGFALPSNVRDEGLQRRGFVTKQMPRGTYDQPDVGTGGYVVPQYVMDEGYGQGTFTTKWEPRGEYDGGRIPHWLNDRPRVIAEKRLPGGARKIVMSAPVTVMNYGNGSAVAMSGVDPIPPAVQDYGSKAASVIIARIAALPPSQRKRALRQMMDRLDRSLWKRTQDIAAELARQGATPGQAFRAALSRALSAGMAAQLIRAGHSSIAPKPESLLGLGCYRDRSVALGAVNAYTTGAAGGKVTATPPVSTTPTLCYGYSWDPAGAWTRTKVGQVDIPAPPGASCPSVVIHPPAPGPTWTGPMFQAGPFLFPFYEGAKLLITPQTITPDQMKLLVQAIGIASATEMAQSITPGTLPGSAASGLDLTVIKRMFAPPTAGFIGKKIAAGVNPLFRVKDAGTGKFWGLVVSDIGTEAKPQFALKLVSWTQNWVANLIDSVVDLIGHVIDALGDLACELLNRPGASTSAASTGGPTGVAVGIGIEAAKGVGICKTDVPIALPLPPPSTFPILPVAIIGGGLLAVALLTSKKKAAP